MRQTDRGVEIDSQGRVVGLVKIWHWCGNDPLWKDVRRVEVAHLLEYAREGEFDRRIFPGERKPYSKNCGFSKYGVEHLGVHRL